MLVLEPEVAEHSQIARLLFFWSFNSRMACDLISDFTKYLNELMRVVPFL
jgi:hypothetical protein